MGEAVGGTMVLRSGIRVSESNETALVPTRWLADIGLRDRQEPEADSGYSWLEDYLERLAGKEARQEYYARL